MEKFHKCRMNFAKISPTHLWNFQFVNMRTMTTFCTLCSNRLTPIIRVCFSAIQRHLYNNKKTVWSIPGKLPMTAKYLQLYLFLFAFSQAEQQQNKPFQTLSIAIVVNEQCS